MVLRIVGFVLLLGCCGCVVVDANDPRMRKSLEEAEIVPARVQQETASQPSTQESALRDRIVNGSFSRFEEFLDLQNAVTDCWPCDRAALRSDLDRRRRQWFLAYHTPKDISRIAAIDAGHAVIGMTADEVRAALGWPKDVNRTVTAYGVHSQWIYESKGYDKDLYLYFEDAVLKSWQD
jgi:hypothetical protein